MTAFSEGLPHPPKTAYVDQIIVSLLRGCLMPRCSHPFTPRRPACERLANCLSLAHISFRDLFITRCSTLNLCPQPGATPITWAVELRTAYSQAASPMREPTPRPTSLEDASPAKVKANLDGSHALVHALSSRQRRNSEQHSEKRGLVPFGRVSGVCRQEPGKCPLPQVQMVAPISRSDVSWGPITGIR